MMLRGKSGLRGALYGRGRCTVSADRWVEVGDLVDHATIAERAGVTRPAINHWRDGKGAAASHPFPPAVAQFGPTRLWLWSEVEPWLRRYGRLKQVGHSTAVERVRAGAEPIAKPRERKSGRSVPKMSLESSTAISSPVADKPAADPAVRRLTPVRVTCRRALCEADPEPGSVWCLDHEPEVW